MNINHRLLNLYHLFALVHSTVFKQKDDEIDQTDLEMEKKAEIYFRFPFENLNMSKEDYGIIVTDLPQLTIGTNTHFEADGDNNFKVIPHESKPFNNDLLQKIAKEKHQSSPNENFPVKKMQYYKNDEMRFNESKTSWMSDATG